MRHRKSRMFRHRSNGRNFRRKNNDSENMRLIRKNEFIDILNISVNQTLSRTIITSLTTLFVLFSLLLAGGIAVKFFATAMIVGVLVGTYSSIFIASTSLYFLGIGTEQQ